jgi:RNA polymerase sigma-70 factor, ECF subfamily
MTGSPQHALGDQDLIRAVAAADAQAMERFYDRFSDLVMAVCVRILRDRTVAEDLFGDLFVELWQRAKEYSPERGSVATWIVTIARSRGIDRLRRLQRSGRRLREIDDQTASTNEDEPGEQVSRDDEHARVRDVLGSLPQDQRQALELAYFEGLTHIEVATRLSRPLGTVKSHIRQGLIQLRSALRITGRDGDA